MIIASHIVDRKMAAIILIGVLALSVSVMVGWTALRGSLLKKRISEISNERSRSRIRQHSGKAGGKAALRQAPKTYMKNVVDQFSLATWLNTENVRSQLVSAGFRGAHAEVTFLFFRLVCPIVFVFLSMLYVYAFYQDDFDLLMKVGIGVGALYCGVKAPEFYLSNIITKRQESIQRALPDALDLLLICVESGMSVELAFRRVGQEIAVQSEPLAEEILLLNAELSYLSDRRSAYENLSLRTGMQSVKQLMTILVQSEKYGTPLGRALRVAAEEGRSARMVEAEKKAAALPPKMTVPMIVFFLPVLLAVVLGPAGIEIYRIMSEGK